MLFRSPVTSVTAVGAAIRAARKAGGVRQDDLGVVSHMFLRDLEQGKETVQFGRALKVLKELGIRLVMDVPDSLGPELRESISLAEAAAKARADAAEASKKAI